MSGAWVADVRISARTLALPQSVPAGWLGSQPAGTRCREGTYPLGSRLGVMSSGTARRFDRAFCACCRGCDGPRYSYPPRRAGENCVMSVAGVTLPVH